MDAAWTVVPGDAPCAWAFGPAGKRRSPIPVAEPEPASVFRDALSGQTSGVTDTARDTVSDPATWQAPAGTPALIFDCDGTLADTMPIHYVAWKAMLAEHGIGFPETQFYALAGMPSGNIIRLLAGEQGIAVPDDVQPMVDDKERRYLTTLDQVRPILEVVAIAQRFHGVLPLAVASGGERHVVNATLGLLGIAHLFDAVVGYEDTERHKPDPDVFEEAARRLGVPAAGCVVFEDGELGLLAADRAGMLGIDIRPWRSR